MRPCQILTANDVITAFHNWLIYGQVDRFTREAVKYQPGQSVTNQQPRRGGRMVFGVNASPWWRRRKPAPAPRHTSYLSDQDVRDFARKVRHEILISLGRGNEIEPDDQGLHDPRRTWPIEQNGAPAPTPLSLDDEYVAIAGDWRGNL